MTTTNFCHTPLPSLSPRTSPPLPPFGWVRMLDLPHLYPRASFSPSRTKSTTLRSR